LKQGERERGVLVLGLGLYFEQRKEFDLEEIKFIWRIHFENRGAWGGVKNRRGRGGEERGGGKKWFQFVLKEMGFEETCEEWKREKNEENGLCNLPLILYPVWFWNLLLYPKTRSLIILNPFLKSQP